MTAVISVLLGLIVLGVLVFIHELGHFIAAKACGIRVLAFSLGFGKPLLEKTVNGTQYRISAIPFGGYVKMAGENPEDEHAGALDEFQAKPVWQRMIVALAGPLFNYVSAFIMLVIVFVIGIERPLYLERSVVGAVVPASIAEKAGVASGDSIVSVNGKYVGDWETIEKAFAMQEPSYELTFIRDGVSKTITLTMVRDKKDGLLPKNLTGGMHPSLPAVVGEVLPASAAEEAGLHSGDRIVSINGRKVHSWFELVGAVENYRAETPLSFVILRGDNELTMPLLPRYSEEVKRSLIGVRVSQGAGRVVSYPPAVAVRNAIARTWENTTMIFEVLGKLFSRKVSAKQLSGPLGIIPASGFMALQGIGPILEFMAMIGINLAVLNLLPLIITDGGLIFFMFIELIRGRPLSLKTQLSFNKVAMALFLALFLFVSFNDVKRLPEYFRLFGK